MALAIMAEESRLILQRIKALVLTVVVVKVVSVVINS